MAAVPGTSCCSIRAPCAPGFLCGGTLILGPNPCLSPVGSGVDPVVCVGGRCGGGLRVRGSCPRSGSRQTCRPIWPRTSASPNDTIPRRGVGWVRLAPREREQGGIVRPRRCWWSIISAGLRLREDCVVTRVSGRFSSISRLLTERCGPECGYCGRTRCRCCDRGHFVGGSRPDRLRSSNGGERGPPHHFISLPVSGLRAARRRWCCPPERRASERHGRDASLRDGPRKHRRRGPGGRHSGWAAWVCGSAARRVRSW